MKKYHKCPLCIEDDFDEKGLDMHLWTDHREDYPKYRFYVEEMEFAEEEPPTREDV